MRTDRPRRSLRRLIGLTTVGAVAVIVFYPVIKLLVPLLLFAAVMGCLITTVKR